MGLSSPWPSCTSEVCRETIVPVSWAGAGESGGAVTETLLSTGLLCSNGDKLPVFVSAERLFGEGPTWIDMEQMSVVLLDREPDFQGES